MEVKRFKIEYVSYLEFDNIFGVSLEFSFNQDSLTLMMIVIHRSIFDSFSVNGSIKVTDDGDDVFEDQILVQGSSDAIQLTDTLSDCCTLSSTMRPGSEWFKSLMLTQRTNQGPDGWRMDQWGSSGRNHRAETGPVATGMNGASARAGHLLWRSGRWQQMWWHPHPQCQ